MILKRIKSIFEWFEIDPERAEELKHLCEEAAYHAKGMTHLCDYYALAAVLEKMQPTKIFEIGTYLGATSNFFLKLLPHCQVLSIAYVNPKSKFFTKRFNNSNLKANEVGSLINPEYKDRYIQFLGDSHQLIPEEMVDKFGPMDFIFIDGDHSVEGVKKDTELSLRMIDKKGTICWHDANPKQKYYPVRRYLEKELEKPAIATTDDFIGGVAIWNTFVEQKLNQTTYA